MDARFKARVAAYEHASRHEPRRFALVTAGMAALGYAAVLAALCAAMAGLYWSASRVASGHLNYVALLLIAACASLLWSLAGALWSRSAALSGEPVSRAEAPRLFRLIDEVGGRCGGRAPHVVLIDDALNAAIVQQPRLGILGWHRNTLILGLPLLMALDSKQLAGVIAHEFGHLRGAHGKLGAWVYRTRRSWLRLAEARERARVQAGFADAALGFFFQAFFPRFNARAFVLSRQQEYEADRVAHKVAGPRACAEGLIALSLQSRYLDACYWPRVYAHAAHSPTPPADAHTGLQAGLREALSHADAPTWLREAMKRLPDPTDTHPSLRDRLDFAQASPGMPKAPAVSAAESLLGEALPRWLARIDASWQQGVAEGWARRHRALKAQRELAEALAKERERGALSVQDHLLWARAARVGGGAAAETPVLRRLLLDHPDCSEARFELGMTLIESGEAGLVAEAAALLRSVAENEGDPCAFRASRRYERWLEDNERFAELKAWRTAQARIEAASDAAWDALNDFEDRPRFEPHGLSPRVIAPMLELLRRETAVGRAFLVRKTSHQAAKWHFCVLVIERAKGGRQPDAQTWWEDLHDRIDLPCPFLVIDLAHPTWQDEAQAGLVRQMTDVRGACVHAARRP